MQAQKIWTLIARKLAGEASAEDLHELGMALRDDKESDYKSRLVSEYWQRERKASRATDHSPIEDIWKRVMPLTRQTKPPKKVTKLKIRKGVRGLFTTTALYQKSLHFPLMLLALVVGLFFFLFTSVTSTEMMHY